MTMSNVIDLEQRRKQRDLQQPGSDSESRQGVRRRANAFSASGVMLLVPSAALLSFVTYQAVRLQLMGDVFVIGLVIALAAYLCVGYTLVRFGTRPALALSQGVSTGLNRSCRPSQASRISSALRESLSSLQPTPLPAA